MLLTVFCMMRYTCNTMRLGLISCRSVFYFTFTTLHYTSCPIFAAPILRLPKRVTLLFWCLVRKPTQWKIEKKTPTLHIWYTGFKAVSFSLKFHIFFRNKWKQLGLSTDSTELKYVVIETVTLMEMKINFNSCLRRLLNFINYISAKLFS